MQEACQSLCIYRLLHRPVWENKEWHCQYLFLLIEYLSVYGNGRSQSFLAITLNPNVSSEEYHIATHGAVARSFHPLSYTPQSSYSAPWRAAAGTQLSFVTWLMNGRDCVGEIWKITRGYSWRGKKEITLHDISLALAEQGQTYLGYICLWVE